MSKLKVTQTSIDDLLIIEPLVHGDERGFFLESYNKKDFLEIGISYDFVQDNHSRSGKAVLRGLHFQTEKPQGKLVRVVTGAVLDVAVDLRPGSKTFGHSETVMLSEQNKKMFFIPPQFAHGFLTLEDNTNFLYKATDYYDPQSDTGILWNDPDLAIDWQIEKFGLSELIISDKDKHLQSFTDYVRALREKK